MIDAHDKRPIVKSDKMKNNYNLTVTPQNIKMCLGTMMSEHTKLQPRASANVGSKLQLIHVPQPLKKHKPTLLKKRPCLNV